MPRPAFRLARFGRLSPQAGGVTLVLLSLASVTSALAQDAETGPVPDTAPIAGDALAGMRGTVDATGPTPKLSGFTPPSPQNGPGTMAGGAKANAAKFRLPRLRNGAIPEQYPVRLPALQAYPRAARLKGGAAADLDPNTPVAALPVTLRRTLPVDGAPFAPIGYAVGSTRVLPYVQQSLGYDSNPDQVSAGVRASPYSRTEAGLSLESDWSANALKGTLRGAYDDFFRDRQANRPDANGIVDYTLDVTRDTKIDTEARFAIDTQRPGSPELNVNVEGRPLIESFGGTLGITQGFGRFSVGLHGLIDRTTYDNATLTNGDPVDLAFQNDTDYGVKLRVGYDLKPGLQPFVEVGYDTRIHDATVDPGGFRRDSDGEAARVGSSFEFFPQLTGTASVGYATRSYDDPRLKNLSGPTVDGSLAWAATPLTTLTLNGATSFNETTVFDASGIESRTIGIALSHALFRYLTLTGQVIYENDDYMGVPIVENTLTESLKAEYHLSRSLVLTGTLSHQTLKSTVPGSDYTQNVALLGLRLQH